jgi:hypothetical protein
MRCSSFKMKLNWAEDRQRPEPSVSAHPVAETRGARLNAALPAWRPADTEVFLRPSHYDAPFQSTYARTDGSRRRGAMGVFELTFLCESG